MAKSKAEQVSPWIKPVATVAGIWAGWKFVVKPVLEGLGLKDTDEELASKKLQDKVENLSAEKNYWSPRFYQNPPAGYLSMILTYQSANSLSNSLEDAAGIFNDDESKIYAIFRQLKYKTQVSYLAYYFNKLFNKDLYNWLKNEVLNDEELQIVLKMTEQLPNGYKNHVTGTISGKTNSYQYFENIVDSISNDELKWAKSLYKSLSSTQKKAFWKWYETTYYYEAQDEGNMDYVEDLKHLLEPGIGRTGSMQIVTTKTNVVDGTSYKLVQILSGKTLYEFMQVEGKFNYVSVLKKSNNPFGSVGKEYKNWDDAIRAYKNPTIKNMIVIAENTLRNI